MKYILNNLRFPVQETYDVIAEICKKTGLSQDAFELNKLLRLAIDTRKSGQPWYDASVIMEIGAKPPNIRDLALHTEQDPSIIHNTRVPDNHPAIVGMGPAGLFCALAMVGNGLQPRLYDRGDPLEVRASRVRDFWENGILDPQSNVQFGEGGAGAFSDGKLTSRSRGGEYSVITDQMIRFGAPDDIAYKALPHLGTDGIRTMVTSIREHLKEKGCEFHYRAKLEDVRVTSGSIKAIRINGDWQDEHTVVLALGNSSRDTFRMLSKAGVHLEPKPFAMGVRIEQSQDHINRTIYGKGDWDRILGPANYRLVDKNSGCFTFCMCPGGYVIAASSEKDSITTNGMSFLARSNEFCNAAIVCPVDLSKDGNIFAGMDLQQQIEQHAYRPGYLAPAQLTEHFLQGRTDTLPLRTSFRPGVYGGDISTLLPGFISERLKSALHKFDTIFRGFVKASVLIAPETRTSSPIRITRERDRLNALNISGLYPAGEGSGYAGGIVSSAVDGWKLGSGFRI